MEFIIFAIFIIAFGAICLAKPETIWQLYSSNRDDPCGPSQKYLSVVRAFGTTLIIIGVIVIIVSLRSIM